MRMTFALVLPAFLLTVIALAGCSTLRGANPPTAGHPHNEQRRLEEIYFSKEMPPAWENGTNFVEFYTHKITGIDDKAKRDDFIQGRMKVIDLTYERFVEQIRKESAGSNVAADVAIITMNGISLFQDTQRTKDILDALSTGVIGVKRSVDKNLYFDKTIEALVKTMNAGRMAIRATIYERMEKDIETYRIGAALGDLDEYLRAGTIIGAVNLIVEEATKTEEQADNKLKETFKIGKYGPNVATKEIRGILKPDGITIDPVGEARINEWLTANGLDGESITYFLYADAFADDRDKMARDLKQ